MPGRLCARVLRLDAVPQHLQRLAAQLRDAGLGDVEQLRELERAAALQEVADDHQTVTLGQQSHRVTQVAEQLTGLELFRRLDRGAVGEHVEQREVFVVGRVDDVLEARARPSGTRGRAVGAARRVMMPSASATSRLDGNWPSALASSCSTCSSLRPSVRTERGAQSADRTQSRIAPRMRRAANRSNGTPRVSSNRRAASTRAQRAGPCQLLAIDVAGEVHRDLQHDVVDERQMLLDQLGVIPTLAHSRDLPSL